MLVAASGPDEAKLCSQPEYDMYLFLVGMMSRLLRRRGQWPAGAPHTRLRSVGLPLAISGPEPGEESQGLRHRPAGYAQVQCQLLVARLSPHVCTTGQACFLLAEHTERGSTYANPATPHNRAAMLVNNASVMLQALAGHQRPWSSTTGTKCGRGSWGRSSVRSSCQSLGEGPALLVQAMLRLLCAMRTLRQPVFPVVTV